MENDNTSNANHPVKSAAHPTACEKSYFAQPYNPDASGFYFTDYVDYETQTNALLDRYGNPVEEFEIMFIDGDDGALFAACEINQANLQTWFDDIEVLDHMEKAALYYLVSMSGYNLADALDKIEEVYLYTGRLQDAAQEYFDDNFVESIPENLRIYIDYEAYARDCQLGGDMCEFEYQGTTYTVTNANGI